MLQYLTDDLQLPPFERNWVRINFLFISLLTFIFIFIFHCLFIYLFVYLLLWNRISKHQEKSFLQGIKKILLTIFNNMKVSTYTLIHLYRTYLYHTYFYIYHSYHSHSHSLLLLFSLSFQQILSELTMASGSDLVNKTTTSTRRA